MYEDTVLIQFPIYLEVSICHIEDFTLQVNFQVPGGGRSANHENLAGAFGIPKLGRLFGGGFSK